MLKKGTLVYIHGSLYVLLELSKNVSAWKIKSLGGPKATWAYVGFLQRQRIL